MDIISKIEYLEEKDKILLEEFLQQLLKKEQYKKLEKELNNRREEIKKGETLSHEEIWDV